MTIQTTFRSYILLTAILSASYFNLFGQSDSINTLRNNVIKINLISLPPLVNDLNQKWIGIEYQRILSEKVSFSITTDFGVFEDYTYTKYHDFFDEYEGFSYTREDVRIPGFHIIPSFRYILTKPIKNADFGVYASGNLDYYYYTMKKDIYYSATNQTIPYQNSTYRFNIGVGIGAQYIAFNRISLDLNISLFTKLLSKSTNEELPELYPENSFWRNKNNSTWATINFMLGYTFGCKNKSRKNRINAK